MHPLFGDYFHGDPGFDIVLSSSTTLVTRGVVTLFNARVPSHREISKGRISGCVVNWLPQICRFKLLNIDLLAYLAEEPGQIVCFQCCQIPYRLWHTSELTSYCTAPDLLLRKSHVIWKSRQLWKGHLFWRDGCIQQKRLGTACITLPCWWQYTSVTYLCTFKYPLYMKICLFLQNWPVYFECLIKHLNNKL